MLGLLLILLYGKVKRRSGLHFKPYSSQDGSLLLTSSAFVCPLSSLWRIGETQEHMINFPDEYHVEFCKMGQDRIIGTQGSTATIYDTETGRAVVRLFDEDLANNYARNRFDYCAFID
ncbi:unnamed protein product [Gongylonema pulchrum]|uniref:WD_REPEATS_REGION domain-containing protein n=1 Tax=Gongylonema pulchrum TaxID=637853 RepID=A0A183EJP1_9BILA|nr:unnamed protein product [Gongylonema pulchrum]